MNDNAVTAVVEDELVDDGSKLHLDAAYVQVLPDFDGFEKAFVEGVAAALESAAAKIRNSLS